MTPNDAIRSVLLRPRIRSAVVAAVAVSLLVALGYMLFPAAGTQHVIAAVGPRIFVASGDDIPAGRDLNDNAKRYPEKLLSDRLKSPGWAVYNQAKNGRTSSGYITGGGLSSAYNMRPDLLTIQLGEQNSGIVELVKSCFDKVKDHDFTGANVGAATILGNASLWTNLQNNYTTILQQTRIMMSQRPNLVVAVVNYPNPYPSGTSATTNVPLAAASDDSRRKRAELHPKWIDSCLAPFGE